MNISRVCARCSNAVFHEKRIISEHSFSRGSAKEIRKLKPERHWFRRMVLLLLVAAWVAPLLSGCANMSLLSDKELQQAVSTDVTRKTLREMDPEISDYYRKYYGARFANPNLTFVPDVLLHTLVARTKGPAFTVAATWDVQAILNCRFPSLTKPLVDQLSHGDRYVILLSRKFLNSSLRADEKLILVHEVRHSIQYEQNPSLPQWDCSQPSKLDRYIDLPEEQEAYKAEMRYAQTVLKLTWERYYGDRFGDRIRFYGYFRETLRRLWNEVEAEKGSPPGIIGKRPISR